MSRVQFDLNKNEIFGRCKFKFGILAIIVVTEFEWSHGDHNAVVVVESQFVNEAVVSKFVTVIVIGHVSADPGVKRPSLFVNNCDDLIPVVAICKVWRCAD